MQDTLNNKADVSQLGELEKLIIMRINDIVSVLTKQFADKAETKKALKLLERQLKNLYDLFMSKNGNGHDEDAMFSKKPLGGFSCASCEKDLTNLYGKKVDFMPWSKLPFRDPSERIARVGQGFSKMLSMIDPNQLSRFDQNNQGEMRNTAPNFYQNPIQPDQQIDEDFGGVHKGGNNTIVQGRVSQSVHPKLGQELGRPGSANTRKINTRVTTRVRKQ